MWWTNIRHKNWSQCHNININITSIYLSHFRYAYRRPTTGHFCRLCFLFHCSVSDCGSVYISAFLSFFVYWFILGILYLSSEFTTIWAQYRTHLITTVIAWFCNGTREWWWLLGIITTCNDNIFIVYVGILLSAMVRRQGHLSYFQFCVHLIRVYTYSCRI